MRCCWNGARPWASLPWATSIVTREESLVYPGIDCGGGGCSAAEVISVPMGGASDAYCDLEAPVCLAPPGLSVLPPPQHSGWRQGGSSKRMAEPLLADVPSMPTQMQLRVSTGPSTGFTGAWNENGPQEVRRKLNFSTGDWDPSMDYVPRGNTLWEERLDADWSDEETDGMWGARTGSENVSLLLGDRP